MYFFKGSDGTVIYMGKDKYENEELIRYGLDTDVWFHVDNLSSAHVYLRLAAGQSWENIPQEALEDCCQLVKHHSIEGKKHRRVDIVYTPWANLRKTKSMDVGQVGFRRDSDVGLAGRGGGEEEEEEGDIVRVSASVGKYECE
jgi:coiled-coil domain-containing protein 25